MSRGAVDRDVLFDMAAEAMILFDVGDPESRDALMSAFIGLRDAFQPVAEDHPASVAVILAGRLCDGDTTVVAELERVFTDARALAVREGAKVSKKRAKAVEVPVPDPPASMETAAPSAAVPAPAAATPAGATSAAMPLAGDAELLRDFGVRTTEHLDDVDERLLVLENDASDDESVDAVFRAFHTIKGMAGFLALDAISNLAHESEGLLADVRGGVALDQSVIQSLFSAVDSMRSLVHEATGIGTGSKKPESGAGMVQAASASPAREGTVRVEEARLDALLDTIGEMVIAESMVSAALRSGMDMATLDTRIDRLDKISRELQQMATALRMVPLKMTFARMSRLVRDVSHKSGKKVEFVVSGEETEIDKIVAESLSDPLIHALRNAVDHGIESPKDRIAAGKPETGRVELTAFHSGGAIHVEITDDGRGLDLEKIRARVFERGLAEPGTPLSEQQLLDFVFEPGFSTAETITDVSGRGVGMDVVKRTVEELRGRVSLSSRPGEGTTLSIRLPVTLAIIDGMVVRIGSERYVLPVLAIERSVRPERTEVSTVVGRGLMLRNNDRLIPVVPLHTFLGIPDAEPDPTRAVVVIINEGGVEAGLLVCELLGQQQTVIKPLGEGLPEHAGVAGAAIMPDGEVGLILDAAGLVRLANGVRGE